MASSPPQPAADRDPRNSAFWMFLAFLGISFPKPGEERRAIRILIIETAIVLAIMAAVILTIFHFW